MGKRNRRRIDHDLGAFFERQHQLGHDLAKMISNEFNRNRRHPRKKLKKRIIRKVLEKFHPQEWSRMDRKSLKSDLKKIVNAHLG